MRSRINSLTNGKVAALGIKNLNETLERNLQSVLRCDPEFITMCTRNFFLSNDLWNDLRKAECPKIIVLPFDYMFRNQRSAVNDIKILESLINEGKVGVILNCANEANCLLTDKFCYLSSGALDYNGITNYIENFELMNKNDPNYRLWNCEILEFINYQIDNYRSIKNRDIIETRLQLAIDEATKNFSIDTSELSIEFLNNLLELMEKIDRDLMLATDAYQYLDKNFIELIKCTKKALVKIDCIIEELTRLILTFERNRDAVNQKIFNCIRNEYFCLLPLLDELKDLRDAVFFNTRDEWRGDEGIIEFLSENNTPNNNLIKTFYEEVIFRNN